MRRAFHLVRSLHEIESVDSPINNTHTWAETTVITSSRFSKNTGPGKHNSMTGSTLVHQMRLARWTEMVHQSRIVFSVYRNSSTKHLANTSSQLLSLH